MKIATSLLASALLCGALPAFAAQESPPPAEQTAIDTRISKLTFESGYPSQETVRKLYDEMDFQRASQAYLWGIPAVGLNEWRQAHFDVFKAKNGEMLSYLDFKEKLGILTPNYTTPYIATFVDLEQSGPIVVELPPGLMAGMVLDAWRRVLADLGVVGPDKGEAGKYLILPNGTRDDRARRLLRRSVAEPDRARQPQAPRGRQGEGDRGAHSWHKDLHMVAERHRRGDAGPACRRQDVEPDGKEANWVQTGGGDLGMPPRGMAYWRSLNDVVQREPVMEWDRLILAQLRFLGLKKGKPLNPDARQAKLLEDGVIVGEAMAKANTSDKRVEPPFWPGTHWKHALVVTVDQRAPG